ncbi:potassium transporter KefB [Geovibrio thiophilus]|uniref:Potassium transporter KefB n=1 Tax=Geovibrio thiophilus TaxID=139438 RepID=A0A410JXT6_9BACT|nr:monovalent cation:proton antiporter family protein [Geovibrio thiophilus]QAR32977.1 potassium transporter KefB [Geovibrio thiophilus]
MGIPLLSDITIIFLFAALALFIAGKLKIPEIMGYLITGVLVGPNGFKLIHGVEQVDMMAQIGVVLLLFTIGIEFSLATLISLKRPAIFGGGLQVTGTIIVFAVIAYLGGYSMNSAVFVGMMAAVSGTAIMLKVFAARGEVDSLYGRIALAVSIFQDIAVIPMMFMVPVLAGQGGGIGEVGLLLGKAVLIVVFVFFGARTIVPKILYHVASTRNRELFMITIVLLCLGVAWFTSMAGLSLALGAFLAGIVVSESGYGQQALGDVVPFKDVFTGFFFVSIGMLLNPAVVMANPVAIIVSLLLLVLFKFAVTGFVVNILGYPMRVAVLSGLSLAQVSEFSFILGAAGAAAGLIDADTYSFLIAVTVISMATTPFLIVAAPKLADILSVLPLPTKLRFGYLHEKKEDDSKELIDHIIIAGFGLNGRNTARAAKETGIDFVVIEMNPETVKKERELGTPIFYGDASQSAVLEHGSLRSARIVVVTLPDPVAVRKVVETARRENPTVYILARTRYITEIKPLKDLGADEIIVEEYETAIETFSRVLRKYQIPAEEIERIASSIRFEVHGGSNGSESRVAYNEGVCLTGMNIKNVTVPVGSPVSGKTLRELDLRFRYNVSLLAVRRGQQVMANPGSGFLLDERDELVLMGDDDAVQNFMKSL